MARSDQGHSELCKMREHALRIGRSAAEQAGRLGRLKHRHARARHGAVTARSGSASHLRLQLYDLDT